MAWALAAWTNLFPVPEHSGGVGLAPESLKGASPERLPNKQKVGKSFITAGARPANFAIASSTLSRSLGGHSSTVLQKITTVSLPTALKSNSESFASALTMADAFVAASASRSEGVQRSPGVGSARNTPSGPTQKRGSE